MTGLTLQAQTCGSVGASSYSKGMNNPQWLSWRLQEDPEPEKLSSSLQEREEEEGQSWLRACPRSSRPEGCTPAPEDSGCWELCPVPAASALPGSQGGFTPTQRRSSVVAAQGHSLQGAVKTGCLHGWGKWERAMNSL